MKSETEVLIVKNVTDADFALDLALKKRFKIPLHSVEIYVDI